MRVGSVQRIIIKSIIIVYKSDSIFSDDAPFRVPCIQMEGQIIIININQGNWLELSTSSSPISPLNQYSTCIY